MSAYNPMKARTRLLARYRLKPEDYARLFLAQGGGCGICTAKPSDRRMLDVDHDHRTGEVRGILCHRCNRGLGYFSTWAALRIMAYISHGQTGYFVPKRKRRKRGSGDA